MRTLTVVFTGPPDEKGRRQFIEWTAGPTCPLCRCTLARETNKYAKIVQCVACRTVLDVEVAMIEAPQGRMTAEVQVDAQPIAEG